MSNEKIHRENGTEPLPRMAPLHVPWKRRLQTAAVLFWGIEPALFVCAFLFLAAIPVFWPLAIAYVIWLYMDKAPIQGGRRREAVRNWSYWNYFADYFPTTITKQVDLDPSKNYVFGYHPHGIISVGAIATFASEGNGFSQQFPGIVPSLMTLASNFKIPFHREYILALGMCDVSRQSCKAVLKSGPGRSIAIVIGGAAESLNARPGVMDLTLKKRLGFVKIALETGSSLVPVINFGENDLYEQVKNDDGSWLRKLQTKTQHLAGFTLPLFHGRGIFNYDIGLLPHRRPMHVVFGEPIDPPNTVTEENKDQIVREMHDKYMQNLKALYDRYKDKYAPDRVKELEFVA
ncbi:putative diacylglycerol acyltransferase type 2b [Phascolomyces articulosus]|uniref:Diacylglycerol O-acyltransferase n=1 Tax=Phascolomyces articulosus TaxID=60185 RepID=A0AAD5PHY2_9FUNG|nr:putative diacylglycerol acyltransferase type 2b [Phascolomyces articulosus]